MTFEGWLMVKPGTRCRDRLGMSVGGYFSHLAYPLGCPRAIRPPPVTIEEIEDFRLTHGLDLDLNGDQEAIEARAKALNWALQRGDPSALVARRTWGVPLRDIDLRELEYRLYYHHEGSDAMYLWFDQNDQETYAFSWIDHAAGGLIYVRFTGDQAAQVEALRNAPGILAPERIVGYPVPALYSAAELDSLADLVVNEGWGPLGLLGLMTSVGIDPKENRVEVGACNPDEVAAALIARFGLGAPIAVVYRLPRARKGGAKAVQKSPPRPIRKPRRPLCKRR